MRVICYVRGARSPRGDRDKQGVQPNFPNAWGAIYRDGYVYVPDMNSGLWIVQVDPKSELTP
jgi:hypothetical protein